MTEREREMIKYRTVHLPESDFDSNCYEYHNM